MLKKQNNLIIILFILFILPRISIIYYRTVNKINREDIMLYATYSLDYTAAALSGQNFYKYSFREQQKRLKILNRQKGFKKNTDSFGYFEYPPLALQWIVLPGRILTEFIDFSKTSRPIIKYYKYYCMLYRLQCLVFESLIFIFFLIFIFRSNITQLAKFSSSLCLAFINLLMPLKLYERIDLLIAYLLLTSVLLLFCSKHYIWSYLALAVAVSLKIIPVILIPVLIIYTLKPGSFFKLKTIIKDTGLKTFSFILLISCLTVPFIIKYGSVSLNFIKYHTQRGIQEGSVYAGFLQTFYKIIGKTNYRYFNFGSYNIEDIFGYGADILSILVVLALIVFYCFVAGKTYTVYQSCVLSDNKISIYNLINRLLLVRIIYTVFLVFFVFSKILSPQYIYWIAPLLAFEFAYSDENSIKNVIFFVFIEILTFVFSIRKMLPFEINYIETVILLTRNILIIWFTIIMLKQCFSKKRTVNNEIKRSTII